MRTDFFFSFLRRDLLKPQTVRRVPPQGSYMALAGLLGTQGTGASGHSSQAAVAGETRATGPFYSY